MEKIRGCLASYVCESLYLACSPAVAVKLATLCHIIQCKPESDHQEDWIALTNMEDSRVRDTGKPLISVWNPQRQPICCSRCFGGRRQVQIHWVQRLHCVPSCVESYKSMGAVGDYLQVWKRGGHESYSARCIFLQQRSYR